MLAPRRVTVAGREVIEAVIRYDTANGPGVGAIRLLPSADGEAKAWTFSTTLDFDRICTARAGGGGTSHIRDFAEADWLERRRERAAWMNGDPDVLVVGGGHTGISAAVEVQRLGHSALIVDREERIGDNWRLRYRGLKLHNKTPVNHLRYLPFPVTFPEYIPKDQIANWLESYVDIMDVDFWTRTSFEGASYDDAAARWTVRLRKDGAERTLHPKHIVMATSVSGVPSIPVIDGIAFQTNILALNAAVEAARAGEHGRGFAVVASEVRALAKKSADAARQVKAIVDASVAKIEAGSGQAQNAGTTMQGIVDQVQGVTRLIAEIARASEEQADSIGAVGQAVNQLDALTQQNAALAEQSTAAATSLRDQAEGLQHAVAAFRLPA